MCMFGKAFGNKQNVDPIARDLHARVAWAELPEGGRSQRGLESTALVLNVHDGRLAPILICFLKGELSDFHPPDRNATAPPGLGQSRAH